LKTRLFYHKTTFDTDTDQLLRQYWPGEVVSKTKFYKIDRGWQIAAVVQVENKELLDTHDHEYWNMLFDCDESRGEIHITVK
jgi:hypothetical protein